MGKKQLSSFGLSKSIFHELLQGLPVQALCESNATGARQLTKAICLGSHQEAFVGVNNYPRTPAAHMGVAGRQVKVLSLCRTWCHTCAQPWSSLRGGKVAAPGPGQLPVSFPAEDWRVRVRRLSAPLPAVL